MSWVFGPDRPSFVDWVIEQARTKNEVAAVADKISTPTYAPDIGAMLRPLMNAETGGTVHLANRGACSWQEYGQWALDCCRAEGLALRTQKVDATSLSAMTQFVARRPIYTVLATEKYERLTGTPPRTWQEAVRSYVQDFVGPRLRQAGAGV